MKNITLSLALLAIIFASCSNEKTKSTTTDQSEVKANSDSTSKINMGGRVNKKMPQKELESGDTVFVEGILTHVFVAELGPSHIYVDVNGESMSFEDWTGTDGNYGVSESLIGKEVTVKYLYYKIFEEKDLHIDGKSIREGVGIDIEEIKNNSDIEKIEGSLSFIEERGVSGDSPSEYGIINEDGSELVVTGWVYEELFQYNGIQATVYGIHTSSTYAIEVSAVEGEADHIEIDTDVEQNLIYADNFKFTIKVDRLKNGTIRYSSWNKPKSTNEKANLMLTDGELIKQGSAGGYHYIFSNGDWQYIVENNLMGETDEFIGIFLKLVQNNEEKLFNKLQDLNNERKEKPFLGVWGEDVPIIIADGGDEGYYISFEGGDAVFVSADIHTDLIEGSNFSGKYNIKMISSDPPQFLYSDDGRGHFEPITDRKHEKIKSDNANLLIGRWQSIDDDKSIIEYTAYDILTYYDWEFISREPYILSPKCMNASERNRNILSNHNYISTIDNDLCWYIVSIDEKHLTLSFTGRGNNLKYKRIQ